MAGFVRPLTSALLLLILFGYGYSVSAFFNSETQGNLEYFPEISTTENLNSSEIGANTSPYSADENLEIAGDDKYNLTKDGGSSCSGAYLFEHGYYYIYDNVSKSSSEWFAIKTRGKGSITILLDVPSDKDFNLYVYGPSSCITVACESKNKSGVDESCSFSFSGQKGEYKQYNIKISGSSKGEGYFTLKTSNFSCSSGCSSPRWEQCYFENELCCNQDDSFYGSDRVRDQFICKSDKQFAECWPTKYTLCSGPYNGYYCTKRWETNKQQYVNLLKFRTCSSGCSGSDCFVPPSCSGTDTSCGNYPNCTNCNNSDGCYAYGDGCEERNYGCSGSSCSYSYSNRHTDGYDGGNYCYDNDVYRNYKNYYCSGSCSSSTSRIKQDECSYGCNTSTATCNAPPSCTSGWKCNPNDLGNDYRGYQYSNCSWGAPENCNDSDGYGGIEYYCSDSDRRQHQRFYDYTCGSGSCYQASNNYGNDAYVETCQYGCDSGTGTCKTGCVGNINANAKDKYTNVAMQGAKVYVDEVYKGTTGSNGKLAVQTIDATCLKSHSIKVYNPSDQYCGSSNAFIWYSGQPINAYFSCPTPSLQQLSMTISTQPTYYLNSTGNIAINVKDIYGGAINGASVNVYNPISKTKTNYTTNSSGVASYSFSANKAGYYTFQLKATKTSYLSTSKNAGINITTGSYQIKLLAENEKLLPIANAKVYLNGTLTTTTSQSGIAYLSLSSGTHEIRVVNPNSSECGTRTLQISSSQSVYFNCYFDPNDSDGDSYDNEGENLAGSDPNNSDSTPFTAFSQYVPYIDTILHSSETELITNITSSMSALQYNAKTGELSVSDVSANSWGMPVSVIFGFAMGFTRAVFDMVVDLFTLIKDGLWYLVYHITDINKIAGDIIAFFRGFGGLFNSETLSKIWNGYWRDCLVEANNGKPFTFDEADEHAFNNTYCSGKIVGNVATLFIGVGEVKSAISSLKLGILGTEVANVVTKAEKIWIGLKSILRGLAFENRIAITVGKAVSLSDEVVKIEVTLADSSKVAQTIIAEDVLKLGAAQKLATSSWSAKVADEALETVMKASAKSMNADLKIVSGNVGDVIKYNQKYVLAIAEDGKNIKIWKVAENNVVLSPDKTKIISKAGNPAGELDRFGLIDSKPIIGEGKSGSYEYFKDTLDVSDLKTKKIEPIKDLYGETPAIVVGAPKGQVFGVGDDLTEIKPTLKAIEQQLGGTTVELPLTPTQFEEAGKILEETFRKFTG